MPATLIIQVLGAKVVVRSSDNRLEETLDNLLAVAPGARGQLQIQAVGRSLEDLETHAAAKGRAQEASRALARVRMQTAFDVEAFDARLAAAFVSYVAMDAKLKLGWAGSPTASLELPGFERLPQRSRSAFLKSITNVRLSVNGKALWTPSTATALAWIAAAVAAMFAPMLLALPLHVHPRWASRAGVVLAMGVLAVRHFWERRRLSS